MYDLCILSMRLLYMIGYDYVNLLRKHLSYDYVVKVEEC